MRRALSILGLVLVAHFVMTGETIDRVVAVVNAHAILLSEWDTAARLEALLDHKPLESITDTTRRATFERMIDQDLLGDERENSSVNRSTSEDVAAKILEIRQQFPEAQSDSQWAAVLVGYGVTEQEVETAAATELDDLRLIDFRLRSGAQPDANQVAHYYQTVYEPAMHAKRARPAALADVTAEIREILTQQKLTEATAAWLQTLRAQANIQINVRQIGVIQSNASQGNASQPEAPSKP